MALNRFDLRRNLAGLLIGCLGFAGGAQARHGELPNRIPEPPPYHIDEANTYAPPFESKWTSQNGIDSCAGCHPRVFEEWNGSMKANAWRDPGWRGAFLLVARLTSTDGNCDIPDPPDGTAKATINPFANTNCTSTFNIGTTTHTTSASGSLMDDFCARCHMPSNYVDAYPKANIVTDAGTNKKHGLAKSDFDPTSDNGTGIAFAKVTSLQRNTDTGELGIFCSVCHTMADSRHTPYHGFVKSGTEYYPANGTSSRASLVPSGQRDIMNVPDATKANLGFGIGAGAYVLSPHAIATPERFGPLSYDSYTATTDPYVSDVFNITFKYQKGDFSWDHVGYYHVKFERAEMCGACHDVTNPMTIKNQLGKWVGGFPIERTYTEWLQSRYADRPGNTKFDPNFKRDCQTCHMQQDWGNPGTAKSLYVGTTPVAPVTGKVCNMGMAPTRPVYYTHHFVGANTYISNMIGATAYASYSGGSSMHGGYGWGTASSSGGTAGDAQPWPELSAASYSSSDKNSKYYNAYFNNANKGNKTHHARMAWDRLRNALSLSVTAPASANAASNAAFSLKVVNDGAGHSFPTGFPEGRNAWVSVRAWNLANGQELSIYDSFWNRTSVGVGYLTTTDINDPMFPTCNYKMPIGSMDPYAYQFRAVATLGDNCPTLALPYATPVNLVVNSNNMPTDANGVVIDKANPDGLPRYTDVDGDGDLFDDSFLVDTRLRAMPHSGATLDLNRYQVVIPAGTVGPIAVTAAVYYQSFEAQVSKKFLGNLADTDLDKVLEPCVLKGACDGRTPSTEPAVVEGAAPVPIAVVNAVIKVNGAAADTTKPTVKSMYPTAGFTTAYRDVVPKISFSEPVKNVESKVTLKTSSGVTVPARVQQISDGTYGIFADGIFLSAGTTYTASVASGVCDYSNNCTTAATNWSFTVSSTGSGNTTIPLGF